MVDIYYETCYIGIPIPEELKPHYIDLQKFLKSKIPDLSFEHVDSAHITVYYLGNLITKFIEEIDTIIKPTILKEIPKNLMFSNLDVFERNDPQTLYITIKNADWLYGLNKQLSKDLQKYNFQERAFTPHMTVARIREKSTIDAYYQNELNIKKFTSEFNYEYSINKLQIRGKEPETKQKTIFRSYSKNL